MRWACTGWPARPTPAQNPPPATRDLFDENGPVWATIDVRDVVVNGPVGTVDGVMSIDRDSGDVTWPFKKEDGEWRFCPSLSQSPSSGSGGDDDIITG